MITCFTHGGCDHIGFNNIKVMIIKVLRKFYGVGNKSYQNIKAMGCPARNLHDIDAVVDHCCVNQQ